jgi:signal transduction histidine kinase
MSQTIASLEELLAQSDSIAEGVDLRNALAWRIHKSEMERAVALSEQAYERARQLDPPYRQGMADALVIFAQDHYFKAKYDQAIAKASEALALLEHEPHPLPTTLARCYNTLAGSYRILGNLSESLDYYFKQLEVVEQVGDKESYASALVGVGAIYYDTKDYANALAYFERSLEAFRELDDAYWMAIALNNMAFMRLKMGDPQAGLAPGHEGLQIARAGGHDRVVATLSMTLGEIYDNLDDLPNAMLHLETGVTVARGQDHATAEVDGRRLIGQAYLRRNQPEKGLPYLQEALAQAEAISHRRFIYQCHQLLAETHKALGDFAQALSHYEQFIAARELVYNEESSQKLQNMEALYRTQAAQRQADYYAALYESEQSRRHLSEVMNQVGRALTSTLDLNEVLDQILAKLHELVPYDRGSALLLRGQSLEFVAGHGYDDLADLPRVKIPIDAGNEHGVFSRIYRTKQPFALLHAADYPYWQQVGDLPPPGAWLGIPLINNDVVMGMLSLARLEPTPYEEEAVQLATMFADQAAIALTNARLYNQIRRFNQQLEDEVNRRTQALLDAYQQLERLDRAKSDFITVTAHELRTPITVLKGYGQLLETDGMIQGSQYHQGLVAGMVAGAERLHQIVNTMLMMIKIDSRSLEIHVEPLDLRHLLRQAAKDLGEDLRVRQQTLHLDESLDNLPPLSGDKGALMTVFSNLLVNAIKYTPDGGEIRVHGRSWTEPLPVAEQTRPNLPDAGVQIVISDTGIGINPDAHELIFTKFYQTGEVGLHSSGKTKFKGGGPGLGLAIARGIIEAHRGQIWVESPEHNEKTYPGSHFFLVLPLRSVQPTLA